MREAFDEVHIRWGYTMGQFDIEVMVEHSDYDRNEFGRGGTVRDGQVCLAQ